ncbi:MAG: FAD-binding oxidoreductase [Candidatus Colwellbacteria bacterium]|nr:FAD-binding oxidoreductase [Candidatus Colwellbacteria bacterium]
MADESKIKEFFNGDILSDDASLEAYSRDASIFQVRPEVVLFPKDVYDIESVVKFVSAEKKAGRDISLTPRSAGTDMTGGPLTKSIVLDLTKYFNHIKEVGSDYALTEPGVFYRDFEKETLKHNLLLPSYPASREICTVGGMVANNSGGEKTLVYGKTEKYVEAVKMVLSDGKEYDFRKITFEELQEKDEEKTLEGKIYKGIHRLIEENYDLIQEAKPDVSKNSAGYYLWNVMDKEAKTFDLTKIIVGSQGTLGIITEMRFRLIKPKSHSRLLVIFLKDLKPLTEIAERILKFNPESFESYDANTIKVAMKFLPDVMKILKGNALTLAMQFLPEFWMAIFGGMPKLVLLAEFTGDTSEEVAKKLLDAKSALKDLPIKMRVTKTERETKKYWTLRRESFNLLRHHMKGLRTAPFIDDIIVKPDKLFEFLPALNAILAQYHLLYTIAGHIGDANFHIIPLMKLSEPKSKEIISELSEKVYKLVLDFGGSITAEHNDGLVRSPYLKTMYGDKIYRLFEETKRIFDPDTLFNPGKKVGSSLEYSLNHVDTSV